MILRGGVNKARKTKDTFQNIPENVREVEYICGIISRPLNVDEFLAFPGYRLYDVFRIGWLNMIFLLQGDKCEIIFLGSLVQSSQSVNQTERNQLTFAVTRTEASEYKGDADSHICLGVQ